MFKQPSTQSLCFEFHKAEILTAKEKEYIATLKLGATTPSFDLESAEDQTFPTDHITPEFIQEKLKIFMGVIDQVPPVFSAVKINGKRAYEHARKGDDIVLQPKKITIYEAEILEFSPEQLVLRIVCSKGTYIRSLARDLGIALNSGAYLTGLCRTRIGQLKLDDAWDLKVFLENLDKTETN